MFFKRSAEREKEYEEKKEKELAYGVGKKTNFKTYRNISSTKS